MATRRTKTIRRDDLTLTDILSRLNFLAVAKLLGAQSGKLIQRGGHCDIDIDAAVHFTANKFRLNLDDARVVIRQSKAHRQRLGISCSECREPCEHQGAALSLVIEEKLGLGLSVLPVEKRPLEHLSQPWTVNHSSMKSRWRAALQN